jgi:carbohydrate kinase (thermoresistant glucokinase family)
MDELEEPTEDSRRTPCLGIVDAHHHLLDLRRSYPWLQGPAEPFRCHGDDRPIRRDYLVDDYLGDIGSLDLIGSVHIENGAGDPVAETLWIDSLVRERGIPSVQVAKADLLASDAPGVLEAVAAVASARGVRHILNGHPDPLYTHTDRDSIITDPVWLRNFSRLAGLGLSFDLQVCPHQLEAAAKLAAGHPDTAIVLDHAGMPVSQDRESLRRWRTGMRRLAAEPNVFVKISALGTNDHHWTTESIRPFVLDTIEIFGPARCMFGSNFPVGSLYSTFGALYAAFGSVTAAFSADERHDLFAGTARRFYRFTARAGHPAQRIRRVRTNPGPPGGRQRGAGPLVVVMGVSGSGKSTVGALLAERLGLPYAEADDFHPPANIAKMATGVPLDDTDRAPWLDLIAAWLAKHSGTGGVITCSALRRRYRDRLRAQMPEAFFLHLDGSEELIGRRLAERTGHFMPPGLLRSQLEALDPLEADEAGAVVSVDATPEELAERALAVIPR